MRVGWVAKSADARVASVRFRCLTPIRALRSLGVEAELFDPLRPDGYDVVVFSKRYGPADQKLAHELRARGVRTALDLSDNHFYNPFGLPEYAQAARDIAAMAALVDQVICCSEALAEAAQQELKLPAAPLVVGDAVESLPPPLKPSNFEPGARFSILWFGSHGSPNAPAGMEDVLRIAPQLREAHLARPCEFVVVSNNEAKFRRLRPALALPARYREFSQEALGEELARANLVVIPISENLFTRCKSNNRLATALWHGAPAAADPIPAYLPLEPFCVLGDFDRAFAEALRGAPELERRTEAGAAFVRAHCSDAAVAEHWRGALQAVKTGTRTRGGKGEGYLQSPEELSLAASLPVESRLRGLPLERYLARLRQERAASETTAEDARLHVLLLAERPPDEGLAFSLATLALQSSAIASCTLIPLAPNVSVTDLQAFRASRQLGPEPLRYAADWAEAKAGLPSTGYVSFLRQGEGLAPNTCAALAAVAHAKPDLILWGSLHTTAGGALVSARRTAAERFSMLHAPVLGAGFALAGALADTVALAPGRDLGLQLHLAQIAWALNPQLRWAQLGEHLLLRRAEAGDPRTSLSEDAIAAYRDVFARRGDAFEVQAKVGESCYALQPRHAPRSIAVVIPFRDKPELTVRAMRSVYSQVVACPVELLLVDNRSSPASRAAVEAFGALAPDGFRCRILTYDAPFNHSAQCNLAARETGAEALLLLNNDAELLTPSALDLLARWALVEGVFAAGAVIAHPPGGDPSAGIMPKVVARPGDSLFVEQQIGEAALRSREVFGVSFACAAIARSVYFDLGGLDEQHFPVGYNDIAFACAARRRGLRAVVLASARAAHAPGQSRGRTDEAGEKSRLLQLYPEAAAAAHQVALDLAPEQFGAVARARLGSVRSMGALARARALALRFVRHPLVQRALLHPRMLRMARRMHHLAAAGRASPSDRSAP